MKTYRDWLRRLNEIAKKLGYKYRLSDPEWRVYYEEGYTPGAALAEDESYA